MDEITRINEDLNERLMARSRAISNWKRLKIVIVILKMSGGRVDESAKQEQTLAVHKKPSCDDWFSKFVITPFSRYLIIWNIITTLVYLIAIFMDTLIIGFHL